MKVILAVMCTTWAVVKILFIFIHLEYIFIHQFTGLFGTNIMTSSQLAC